MMGPKSAVHRALSLIEDLGPSLVIIINVPKYELFSHNDVIKFPPTMKVTHLPHLDVLGAPIGDNLHCAGFFANKF